MHKNQLGNIGKIISKAIRFGVHCVPAEVGLSNYSTLVGVKPFIFDINKHDTGISVRVYIKHPKTGENYQIINGTYWHNESSYGHNKFTWEDGKWNDALVDAIATIVTATEEAEAVYDAEQEAIANKQNRDKQAIKTEFENIF